VERIYLYFKKHMFILYSNAKHKCPIEKITQLECLTSVSISPALLLSLHLSQSWASEFALGPSSRNSLASTLRSDCAFVDPDPNLEGAQGGQEGGKDISLFPTLAVR